MNRENLFQTLDSIHSQKQKLLTYLKKIWHKQILLTFKQDSFQDLCQSSNIKLQMWYCGCLASAGNILGQGFDFAICKEGM